MTTSATGNNAHSKESGFTLIELITVIAIVLFLAGLMLGAGSYIIKRSACKAASAQIMAISKSLERYAADHRSYPAPVANVSLFPPDASDTERAYTFSGLALSAISSQYSDGGLSYYEAKIEEIDVNIDNELTDSDKFSNEYILLDVWGYPLYYNVVKRTITYSGSSIDVYFGQFNVNGCDLASRGPDHVPNNGSWGAPGTSAGDDIRNWD